MALDGHGWGSGDVREEFVRMSYRFGGQRIGRLSGKLGKGENNALRR